MPKVVFVTEKKEIEVPEGSNLRAEALKDFLREKNVIGLYSPPHRPSYNGSIEASIGSLKTRTEQPRSRRNQGGFGSTFQVLAMESYQMGGSNAGDWI